VTGSPPIRSAVEPPQPEAPAPPTARHARRGRLAEWARGPGGRFVVPAAAITALLAVMGSTGAYLTQAVSPVPRPSAASPSAAPSEENVPLLLPTTEAPSAGAQPSTDPVAATQSRPQDALAAWAKKISAAVDIPQPALRAYGFATLRLANDKPGCHLAWTTLAAIGKVESDHGRAQGATLQEDGSVLPPIIGPALNGQNGLKSIPDTDHGRYDGDPAYDHAVGPMQFVPGTWAQYQIDADNDGVADPNDVNDAALAAADYLCAGGRDLATSGGWWGAVLSYNAIQQYAQKVFDAANEYGQRARTVA
jgi:membrane-bound lytic murein transglycosylase B